MTYELPRYIKIGDKDNMFIYTIYDSNPWLNSIVEIRNGKWIYHTRGFQYPMPKSSIQRIEELLRK